MRINFRASIALAATALAISFPVHSWGMQAPAAKPSASASANKPAPTPEEIADAKAKGMVWVNLKSKVYHKDDAQYGKTKNGQFMTEEDAVKAGYRPAKTSAAGTKKAAPATTPAPASTPKS
jgi:hypothetical protein